MTAPLVAQWSPPEQWPTLSGVIGLDVETREKDVDLYGPGWALPGDFGEIVGISVAWDEGQNYWPVAHEGGGNLPAHAVWSWLRDQLRNPDLTVVCHQSMYERGWLAKHGVSIKGTVVCTQTAAALINEYRRGRYNLDDTGWDYLQQRKNESELIAWAKAHKLHPKRDLWRAPAHIVAPYGIQDSVITKNLWPLFKKMLSEQELTGTFQLEMDLQPVLLTMRARGVRVDTDRAERAIVGLKKLEQGLQAELKGLAHFEVDADDIGPWKAGDIASVFDARDLTYHYTPKTEKPSFRKHWLAAHPDPVAQQIMQLREFNRLRTMFLQRYVLDHQVNGRIYTEFNPVPSDEGGAVTGRFSSSNPTLQNLPARSTQAAQLIRGVMLPEEGQLWAANDYSQQEPRFMVHFGAVMNEDLPERLKLKGVDELVRAYHTNPKMDCYEFLEELTGRKRSENKIVFLARAYGRGGGSMCVQLGLPYTQYEKDGQIRLVAGPEGQAIINAFDEAVPFLGKLSKECERRGVSRGYIKTILGRRCRIRSPRFPESRTFAYPYKALNRLIQGSSADQTKKAMIELSRAGFTILVTVHDELGLSVSDTAEARAAAEIMENCLPLHVPSKVDVAIGDNWGEAM